MKLIERYPTVAMFLTFFLSSCILAYCPLWLKIAVMGISLFFLLGVAFRLRRFNPFNVSDGIREGSLLICGALLTASLLSAAAFDLYAAHFEKQDGKSDTVTLQIAECVYSLPYMAEYEAVVRESELLPRGSRLLVSTSLTGLEEGTLLEGEVNYAALSRSSHGTFDGVRYYLPKRILITAEEEELIVTGSRFCWSVSGFFHGVNETLSARLNATLRQDAAGIASAVLLGNRDSLSASVTRDFRRIGVSHLLVVSGTHFAVIITLLQNLMSHTMLHRRYRAMITIAVIVFFMGLTGFTPSVMRAGIMHLIAQLGLIVSRRANTTNSFAISGTLMILFNPFCAMDCGLQLSYVATLCCILFQQYKGSIYRTLRGKTGFRPRKNRLTAFLSGIGESILLTSLVTLCMLPLMWLYFGEISLLSVPANLVFIPLITVLMYLTGAFLLLYPLRILTPALAWLLNVCCSLIQSTAGALSRQSFTLISIRYSFSLFFLIPLTMLLFGIPFCSSRMRRPLLLSAAAVCVGFIGTVGVVRALDRDRLYFSYLPEKKNDGFVLVADGKALICEISDASFGYSYQLTDELSALHCCEIESMLLTHYHNKHIQLVSRLCEREILRSLILPEPVNEKEKGLYLSLCELAEQYDAEVITIPGGGSFSFGDAEVTLFERTYLSRSTHPITAVSLKLREETAVILSASFHQSVPEITEAAEASSVVIFGNHSPVYKKTFDLSFAEKPKVMIVSDDAYLHMEDGLRQFADEIGAIRPEPGDETRESCAYRLVVQKSPN